MEIGGKKHVQLSQNARTRLIAANAIVAWYDFFIFVTMSVLPLPPMTGHR